MTPGMIAALIWLGAVIPVSIDPAALRPTSRGGKRGRPPVLRDAGRGGTQN